MVKEKCLVLGILIAWVGVVYGKTDLLGVVRNADFKSIADDAIGLVRKIPAAGGATIKYVGKEAGPLARWAALRKSLFDAVTELLAKNDRLLQEKKKGFVQKKDVGTVVNAMMRLREIEARLVSGEIEREDPALIEKIRSALAVGWGDPLEAKDIKTTLRNMLLQLKRIVVFKLQKQKTV